MFGGTPGVFHLNGLALFRPLKGLKRVGRKFSDGADQPCLLKAKARPRGVDIRAMSYS